MKKKILDTIKLVFYAILGIIGFSMLAISLILIYDNQVNYVKTDATIIKYKNGGDNLSLSGKDIWSINGEEILLGYQYNNKYYETFYHVFISNDYNDYNIGSTTKIKVNPKNPHEIFWKADWTPYYCSFFGLCFIILFFRKIKHKEEN